MIKALFVAGSGTDVGKTYVTAGLAHSLRARGARVRVCKPLASGVPPTDDPCFTASDPAVLIASAGLPLTAQTLNACTPWRFAVPLSPDMAASAEGRTASLDEVAAWTRAVLHEDDHDVALVEGAGGVMSPITQDATGLDLAAALSLPVLLVCGSYLGAISHGLTALAALQARGLTPLALIVSESLGDCPQLAATIAVFGRFSGDIPVHGLARGASLHPEAVGF